MLAGLGHRAVSCVHNQDRAVHLRRTGDHVFHIVSVAGAVDVCVVACFGLILNVGGRDGDAAGFFFGCAVDLVVGFEVTKVFGDRGGQCGFTVVNVTDGANVNVGFCPFKLLFCHSINPLK